MINVKRLGWGLSALLVATMSTQLWAQEPSKPVVSNRLEKVTATVAGIDASTRTVTLNGPHGLVSVVVDPGVRSFDKLHVGDKVTVSYYQGLAAQMMKGGTKVTAPAASTFTTPAQGSGKPGGGAGASVTATVSIQAVDTATNQVAFKRSDGTVSVIAVKDPNMRKFIRTLKPGDVVEVTYTESVAIDVTPAT